MYLFSSVQQVAGIPEEKLVEAHGSFATASCTLCGRRHEAGVVKRAIMEGTVPILCEAAKCKVIVFFHAKNCGTLCCNEVSNTCVEIKLLQPSNRAKSRFIMVEYNKKNEVFPLTDCIEKYLCYKHL